MRKIVLFVLFLQAIACYPKVDTQLATISGIWDRGSTKTVTLFQVVSGRLDTLSTYVLQEDKAFGFAFYVQKEGFYVIGAGNPMTQSDKYTFYFKPGDALSVEVNDTTYVLTGKNTEENIVLADWQQYTHQISFIAIYFWKTRSTYKDFFPLLQSYLQKPYIAKSTKNPVFDRLFAQYQTFDFLNIATAFATSLREVQPGKDDYPDFYRNIDLSELTKNDDLLAYPSGVNLLLRAILCKSLVENKNAHSLIEILPEIKDDSLKGELLLQEAGRLRSYVGYTELMDKYGQYFTLPDQKKRISGIGAMLARANSKPGQAAINFTGVDINGKTVSLSDFKGKMVMVDIWATWCNPCIQEMPHIEKLMKDYQGKDIVFMGVSVDVVKDKPKWEKFLKDKKLQGVQLFAGKGWESEITKFYQVNAIPRFLLFDKNGDIVSTDAPRPSSPEIRLMIDKGLAK